MLIGIVVTPGYALVDTGAQHGVIGEKDYDQLCTRLQSFGLKPRILPTWQAVATGVGGEAKFIKTSEIPTAIKGVCGTVV
eukprot:2932634-Karenia_brevis.AAC.1